jgi:hypothetical protein
VRPNEISKPVLEELIIALNNSEKICVSPKKKSLISAIRKARMKKEIQI